MIIRNSQKQKSPDKSRLCIGTRGRTRTGTLLRAGDFELDRKSNDSNACAGVFLIRKRNSTPFKSISCKNRLPNIRKEIETLGANK